jgi:predicted ATPase
VVGRARALDELRACLARATRGARQLVFVTGEAGIGKTTTVEALIAEAAAADRLRIAHGRCIESHGPGEPFLPLLEAMTRLCLEPGGQTITRTLRRHAPTWLGQMPSVLAIAERSRLQRQSTGVARERMLRELTEAVEVLAESAPLVLWLEDLHWSDPSTVDWLVYLARRPDPARLLVIASYRPGAAPTPDHPLERIKDDLKAHGHCQQLALQGLDQIAVEEYLARRFPGAAPLTELAPTIHQRTEGNPLFIAHVVDDLVRRGVLVERPTGWEIADPLRALRVGIPDDLVRLIGHELDRVPSGQRRILEAASVAGVEFSASVVAAAEQVSPDDVEHTCAELARRAAFLMPLDAETWPDGTVAARYGFRHVLHQEVVYERVPAGRRAQLHRRIGERLETGLGERAAEIATELAMHFERGRDVTRAVRYLRQAGEVATQRSAAREAVRHLTRALDLLRDQPDSVERAEQEVAVQIALGGPLMALKGRGAPEVEQAYSRAQTVCERLGDAPRLFPALWGLFLFRRSRGEIDAAHCIAGRLLALAQHAGDPGLLIQAHHALWATQFACGELAAARAHAVQAVALYDLERHGSLGAVYGNHDPAVCALGHGAWALELCGNPEQASRDSESALKLARTLDHPFSEAHALLYAARVHQFRGDWKTTRELTEAASALARDRGFVQLRAWASITGGWAVAQEGSVDQGLAGLRDGLATIRALGSEEFRTYFLGLLAETLAQAGQATSAVEVVDEALAVGERTGERFYAAALHRLRGELLFGSRHDRDAAAAFATALSIARRQGALALERQALCAVPILLDHLVRPPQQ